ncbi:MAG: hypothetical protein KDA93_18985 [Planctomycetaceae bacterium]|nr:hypothetical protein [Planctomycetaceae bacterium]
MKQPSWALFAAVVLAGQMGLHLMTTQPLHRRIDGLTAEVARLHAGIENIAGSADNTSQANDLLSNLTVQGERVREARVAIDEMRRFEREVRSQGHAAGHTLNLVRNIGRLQDEIIQQGSQITQLEDSLDDLSAFQMQVHGLTSAAAREFVGVDHATQLVKELGALKQDVEIQAKDLELASENLRQLGALKTRVAIEAVDLEIAEAQFARLVDLKESVAQVSSDQINTAEMRLNELTSLKQMIIEGGEDLAMALGLSDSLLSLKNSLLTRGGRVDVARKHADGLLSLEDALADDAHLSIGHAQENLDALVAIEKRLVSQDEQIIAAVESLELMSDLQNEFVASVGGLDTIRRGLMELAMLESTVVRTVASLEPLMDLTNLRRLSADDLQVVARGMLEQRASRVAACDPEVAPSSNSNDRFDTLVPYPPSDD